MGTGESCTRSIEICEMSMHGPRTTRDLRRFGLALGSGLTLMGGFLTWRDRAAGPYLLGIAAALLVCGALFPRVLAPLERIFAKVAHLVTTGLTYVILVIAFFLVIFPIGLLVRLLGKDLLEMKPAPDRRSFWEPVDPEGPTSRPDKPY
jgi:hypothetical protein